MKFCLIFITKVISFFFYIIYSIKTVLGSFHVLSAPISESLGNWGPVVKCPEDMFVSGFQLKIEPVQNSENDNTAINGIRFLCGKIGAENLNINVSDNTLNNTGENTMDSLEGPWGSWGKMHRCSENQYAIGFQMHYQSSARDSHSDKSGATNFRLICSSSGNYEVVEGGGMDWGFWTKTQFCEKHHLICSIQTKIHVSIKDPDMKNCYHRESNRSVDQEALTDLKTGCCELPNPGEICTSVESWKLVTECDNTRLDFFMTCTFLTAVGLSHEISPADLPFFKIYNNLKFDQKTAASYLAINFKNYYKSQINFNKVMEFSWDNYTDKEIWDEDKVTKVSLDIPPGYKVKVYQVVGKCGFYLVKTKKIRRIYSTLNENDPPFIFDGFSNSTEVLPEIFNKLNESISYDLEEENLQMFYPTQLLTYLILGLVVAPICIGLIFYFTLRFCLKKYADQELVSETLSRTSISGNKDGSITIKNMGTSSGTIEMQRY